jgi:regulator of sigma E protease
MDYIIYFGITILILVFVHEFGHFAAAKICKMRVDIFAIGFGKRLFGYNKLTGFSFGSLPKDFDGEGNTDYRICLIPLGGYVKIAGMVDESFDNKFAEKEPLPDEFRAKPTYQKLFVITAGVMMNLTLAIVIFAGANFIRGKQIIKTTTVGSVVENSAAFKAGFKPEDKIISVNGQPVEDWNDVVDKFLIKNFGVDLTINVQRGDTSETIEVPGNLVADASSESFFLSFGNVKPFVGEVVEDSPASDAGIEPGDIFISLNNIPVQNRDQTISIIKANKENEIPISLLRGDSTVYSSVRPGIDGKIGIILTEKYVGPVEYKAYGLFESFFQSIGDIGTYTELTIVMVKNVIFGETELGKAFGGPVKIAKIAADSADLGIIEFLRFLALLSLSLAIINIMPFPVLDGGHFIIILIEGIIKKELPLKVKIAIQNTGFILLLLLMMIIIYNDIINL